MSTTTIRLDVKLKARLAAAARRAGKTPHALILEAIEDTLEQSESMDEIDRLADERWAAYLKDGKTISFEQAAAHVRAYARRITKGKGAKSR